MHSSLSEVCAQRLARYWSNKQTGDNTKPGIRCRNHLCAINDIEMSTTRWPSLTLASQSQPGPLLQMSNVTSSSTGHKVVHAGKIRRFEEEERVWGGGWGGESADPSSTLPHVVVQLCVCAKDLTGHCWPPNSATTQHTNLLKDKPNGCHDDCEPTPLNALARVHDPASLSPTLHSSMHVLTEYASVSYF